MPAALPGSTRTQNLANPSLGQAIIFDELSGPKGSPLDVRRISGYVAGSPTYVNDAANQTPSTGAMQTGIGWGCNATNPSVAINPRTNPQTAAQAIRDAGFTDDTGEAGAANSSILYIGGGKSAIVAGTGPSGNGATAATNVSVPVPYTVGFAPGNAGNGASRDGGAGPAFTGFAGKWVTAIATVANGAVVETGFVNRCGFSILTTQSVFGSASAQQAAPS